MTTKLIIPIYKGIKILAQEYRGDLQLVCLNNKP